jgi:Histidine kinase-, DNA gyrase B-, and HSP90-like ATPase
MAASRGNRNVSEDYEISAPKPCALVESLRSVGYSAATALADILDNSITAQAKNIRIDFLWDGPDSKVLILDDGAGMDEATLVNAMRPGSANPLDNRRPEDLGRFGLGLKTASFSQCRKLTVWSRRAGGPTVGRCWDLDYVARHDEWRLLKVTRPEDDPGFDRLASLKSGTLVVWEQLDRAVDRSPSTSREAHQRFLQLIDEVRAHLGMIFHRFLEGGTGGRRHPALQIRINGSGDEHWIRPWNPFSVEGGPSSKETPTEKMSLAGHTVTVQGFVMPHKDRLTDDQYADAAGPHGWVAQQGFYIYRNHRIIVPGDWLRLGRTRAWAKEEQYKLARLAIDIPNVMDEDWGLDIKKSTARPPAALRGRLADLAENVRRDARQVFAHRGEHGPRPNQPAAVVEPPWKTTLRSGRNVYVINRSHPLIAQVLTRVGPLAEHLEPLLRLIEETVPVERIWLDTAESPDEHALPYEGCDEAVIMTDICLARDHIRKAFENPESLRMMLASTEPFRRYPELVKRAIEEMTK